MTTITKEQAKKSIDTIEGHDHEYDLNNIRTYIAQLEANQRQPVSDEKMRESIEWLCGVVNDSGLLLRNGSAALNVHKDNIESGLSELETLRAKNAQLEDRVKVLSGIISSIKSECEMNMRRAGLYEKRAIEDAHTSEQHHQDGRWHGNNDVLEFIQRQTAALAQQKGE